MPFFNIHQTQEVVNDKAVLLWSNPNLNTAFAPQQIPVARYKSYIIEFNGSVNTNVVISRIYLNSEDDAILYAGYIANGDIGAYRGVSFSDGNIVFNTCYANGVNNNYLIATKIYGYSNNLLSE